MSEWRDAAIQAKNDLRAIEAAFRDAKSYEEMPIGPGTVFANWTSPANTMRWIEKMEADEAAAPVTEGETTDE